MKTPEVTITWDAEAEVFVSRIPALGVLGSGITEQEARCAVFSVASMGFRYLCDQASNGEHTTYLRMAAQLATALEDTKRLDVLEKYRNVKVSVTTVDGNPVFHVEGLYGAALHSSGWSLRNAIDSIRKQVCS